MASITQVELSEHPDTLSQLEVQWLLLLVESPSRPRELPPSWKALDWSLNHQVRHALLKNLSPLPVFIPTQRKITPQFVVIALQANGRTLFEKNCSSMGMTSLAISSETGKIPNEWSVWNTDPQRVAMEQVILCSERLSA